MTAGKFTDEKPDDRFDPDRPLRGQGGPSRDLRNRGLGGPGNRAFDSFDQKGKEDFERYSSNDKANRMEESVGGCGICLWASGEDTSDTEPPAPMEETSMMEECQGALDEESAAK